MAKAHVEYINQRRIMPEYDRLRALALTYALVMFFGPLLGLVTFVVLWVTHG